MFKNNAYATSIYMYFGDVIMKDGLQEATKCDNWPRRHFFFPGNFCLHLRDISAFRQYNKSIKTQFST
jgi:hypothetical protein